MIHMTEWLVEAGEFDMVMLCSWLCYVQLRLQQSLEQLTRMRHAAFIKYKLFCFFVFVVVTCLVARATDITQASGTN